MVWWLLHCCFNWLLVDVATCPACACLVVAGTVPPEPGLTQVITAIHDGLLVEFYPPESDNGTRIVEHEVRVVVHDPEDADTEETTATPRTARNPRRSSSAVHLDTVIPSPRSPHGDGAFGSSDNWGEDTHGGGGGGGSRSRRPSGKSVGGPRLSGLFSPVAASSAAHQPRLSATGTVLHPLDSGAGVRGGGGVVHSPVVTAPQGRLFAVNGDGTPVPWGDAGDGGGGGDGGDSPDVESTAPPYPSCSSCTGHPAH